MGIRRRGRPGGNPELGTKYKFPRLGEEILSKKQLQIKLPVAIQERLDAMDSGEKNTIVRAAIVGIFENALKTNFDPLIIAAIEDAITSKKLAIAREKRTKNSDGRAIALWQMEIEKLEIFLENS